MGPQGTYLPPYMPMPLRPARTGGEKATQANAHIFSHSRPILYTADANPPRVESVVNLEGVVLRFYTERESGVRMIQLIDKKTGDVIREIPTKKTVHFVKGSQETKGLLLDIYDIE